MFLFLVCLFYRSCYVSSVPDTPLYSDYVYLVNFLFSLSYPVFFISFYSYMLFKHFNYFLFSCQSYSNLLWYILFVFVCLFVFVIYRIVYRCLHSVLELPSVFVLCNVCSLVSILSVDLKTAFDTFTFTSSHCRTIVFLFNF